MAIGKTSVTTSGASFKNVIGVGTVQILGINPTADEMETLMGYKPQNEPVYVGSQTDADGKEVKFCRIGVVVKTVAEECGGIETTGMMNFFIRDAKMTSQAGKTKVMDNYRRTAWVTAEDFKAGKAPIYSNGPARICTKTWAPLYNGEEALTNMLATFLRIPSADAWDDKAKKMIDNPRLSSIEDATLRFDDVQKIIKGDISEVKEMLAYQPDNKMKVLFTIRVDQNTGKMYQDIFTDMVLSANSNNYNRLAKEVDGILARALEAGRTVNTIYEVSDLHYYEVEASQVAENTEEAPAAPAATEDNPW